MGSPVRDNWNFNASNPVVYVGGNFNHNANRGMFYVNNTSATNKNANYGCRILLQAKANPHLICTGFRTALAEDKPLRERASTPCKALERPCG